LVGVDGFFEEYVTKGMASGVAMERAVAFLSGKRIAARPAWPSAAALHRHGLLGGEGKFLTVAGGTTVVAGLPVLPS
jgi:hypothetical protein